MNRTHRDVFLFLLLFFLFFILGKGVTAKQCETAAFKVTLQKTLYTYFENPSSSELTPPQLRDLLSFYLTIPAGVSSVNCNVRGEETGTKIEDLVEEAEGTSTIIPPCKDGTPLGECSSTTPQYCYAGRLENRCSLCGCGLGEICNSQSGVCTSS